VVRATNWVGDAVMSLPAIRAVRERFPRAHLAVLAKPWVADVYGWEPGIDEIVPYTGTRREIAARIRGYDAAILLPNSFDSALVAWMARIPVRVGYRRDGRGLLLTHPIARPEPGEIPRHERFYYLELLRRAGLLPRLPSSPVIRMERPAAAASPPVVGVSPGAAFGGAKRWLPERFAEAAEGLARELGGRVSLFGSGAERKLCEGLAARLTVPVTNYAGETTLRQFIELLSACSVFLTNDSGSMHLAAAMEVPTVAVFGATDDTATGPAGRRVRIVREQVECSPCMLRECPIDHRCMTRVTVESVRRAAYDLIQES